MSGNEEEKPIETPQTSPEAIAQPEKEPEYISATKVKSSFTRVRSIEVRGGDLVIVGRGERDHLLTLEKIPEWFKERHDMMLYRASRGDTGATRGLRPVHGRRGHESTDGRGAWIL